MPLAPSSEQADLLSTGAHLLAETADIARREVSGACRSKKAQAPCTHLTSDRCVHLTSVRCLLASGRRNRRAEMSTVHGQRVNSVEAAAEAVPALH